MDKLIGKTESVCNKCLKVIPAKIIKRDGRIFLKKECSEHGKFFEDHVWDDPEIYAGLTKINTINSAAAQVSVALTYRCNLNCPVCYARANENIPQDFTAGDLKKILSYKKVYLTGGEPTVREDLPKIIYYLRRRGKTVSLFSNGIKLADKKYLTLLKKAGLSSVTLQFDSLDERDFEYIRGRKLAETKRKALKNLEELKIPVLLYSVILKNKNFSGLKEIIDFGFSFESVRAVGVNPLWRLGRFNKEDFIPSSKIIKKIESDIGIKKSDWVESTAFLCNLDKFLSFFGRRRRFFSKCMMKCLLIIHEGEYIPITSIFNVKKINQKIETAYGRKSYIRLTFFMSFFIFSQLILNFFINANFRIFLGQIIKNLSYLIKRKFSFFIPLRQISLAIFPTKGNLDFNFIKDCNFKAVSKEDFAMRPACIHRILALEKKS